MGIVILLRMFWSKVALTASMVHKIPPNIQQLFLSIVFVAILLYIVWPGFKDNPDNGG